VSLFTGQDAHLPLLTQFVQLEVPKGESVSPEELDQSELGAWLTRNDLGRKGRDRNGGPNPTRQRHLRFLADIHGLAVQLLTAAADETGFPPRLLVRLDGLLKENVRLTFGEKHPAAPDFMIRMIRPDSDEPIPQDRVTLVMDNWKLKEQGTPAVGAALLQHLQQIVTGKSKVQRCIECQSPFVVAYKGKRFCSHRCSHREGQRRRRVQNKGKTLTST
jgi:hypothetical protein